HGKKPIGYREMDLAPINPYDPLHLCQIPQQPAGRPRPEAKHRSHPETPRLPMKGRQNQRIPYRSV
ncbi:MAG: hypothetical protein ACQKBT_06400, partial [Puniceicoccales bacterium]